MVVTALRPRSRRLFSLSSRTTLSARRRWRPLELGLVPREIARGREREQHGEDRLADTGAKLDRSLHAGGELGGDGEPEPASRGLPASGAVEALEEVRLVGRGDARPLVAHGQKGM